MANNKKKSGPPAKPDNPYSGFRNDRYRFFALVVREVCGVGRYALLVVASYYGAPIASPVVASLLAKL
ncbi:MAG: hypothetical protein IPG98_08885 [Burkholderiales bacterium]|nr:hypothetical protein [Burkholderiales bacterium]MBK8666148.1 hypothetical protein [Burkholderiales bacterium]